jgi:hypothetical protein
LLFFLLENLPRIVYRRHSPFHLHRIILHFLYIIMALLRLFFLPALALIAAPALATLPACTTGALTARVQWADLNAGGKCFATYSGYSDGDAHFNAAGCAKHKQMKWTDMFISVNAQDGNGFKLEELVDMKALKYTFKTSNRLESFQNPSWRPEQSQFLEAQPAPVPSGLTKHWERDGALTIVGAPNSSTPGGYFKDLADLKATCDAADKNTMTASVTKKLIADIVFLGFVSNQYKENRNSGQDLLALLTEDTFKQTYFCAHSHGSVPYFHLHSTTNRTGYEEFTHIATPLDKLNTPAMWNKGGVCIKGDVGTSMETMVSNVAEGLYALV